MSQQNFPLQSASASWQTLPEELKLRIARFVSTTDTTPRPRSFGLPIIPDIDNTLRSVSRETNKFFCDIVSKDYLHIRVFLCRCAVNSYIPIVVHLCNHFLRNRRVPDIFTYEQNLGLDLSRLEIEIFCDVSCERKAATVATFLATPDMMLALYGILKNCVSERWLLQVESKCQSPRTITQTTKILNQMRKCLYAIDSIQTTGLPEGVNYAGFRADIGRRIRNPEAMVKALESHLQAVQDAMNEGVPLEQMVSSLILQNTCGDIEDVLVEHQALWNIEFGWTTCRKYLFELETTYECAILQGIASYLLSRRLTREEQSHFFLRANPDYASRLQAFLEETDKHVFYFNEIDPKNENHPGAQWILPILKARVEFLLAWARLKILTRYHWDEKPPRTEEPLQDDVQCVGDNIDEVTFLSAWGSPMSIVLVARQDMERIEDVITLMDETQHDMHEGFVLWLGMVRAIANRIEEAQRISRRSRGKGVQHVGREMIRGNLERELPYLQHGMAREALHARMVAENWQV